MDADYGQRYRDLYEHHWWWRAREGFVTRVIAGRAPDGGFGPILDVGCGDGLFLDGLDRFGAAQGLEADGALVSPDRAARIHVGPLDDSFKPAERFGLITMLDVLEHIPDDAAALARAREVIAEDGLLVITVPAYQALWTHHDTLNHHHRRYTRAALAETLTGAGFTVLDARYFFHWTVLPKLAVRALEAVRGTNDAGEQVPAAPVNAALRWLSEVEQRTWGHLPLPGSSLLTVARPTQG